MAQTLLPCFSNLVSIAESFEIFQKSLETLAPSEALLIMEATSFAKIMVVDMGPVATLSILDRVVLTLTKVAVHHTTRSADWKDTMPITVSSAMTDMNSQHTLLNLISSWIQGLRLT